VDDGAAAPHGRGPGLHRTESPGPRRWLTEDGNAVTDVAVLDRLRRLAVPPAWTGVWASADPDAPVQATGVDSRGRTQYRYSPRARAEHDADKFAHVALLAEALPRIRAHVSAGLHTADLQDPDREFHRLLRADEPAAAARSEP
jgi:DNA topoisomerase-1